MAKAQRDLDVMELLINGKFIDWAIIASFYVRYHCLLAILAKFGYESRNQECTFALVENLILEGKLDIPLEDFHKIYFYDEQDMLKRDNDIVGLREKYQYGTQANVMDIEVKALRKETKEFIDKTRLVLQDLP
ncbi:HEPN domain-containing protein [Candidatus Woesearchaeota archaeon]|nr:HEPN domain-containing protein [Candidatus Woesearchaeota archaeon]